MLIINLKEQIKEQVGEIAFSTWFQSLDIEELSPNEIIIWTPNAFYKQKIKQQFGSQLKVALSSLAPTATYQIKIQKEVIREIDPSPKEIKDTTITRKTIQNHMPSNLLGANEKYSFDNFIVGQGSSFAHAVAIAVADSPGRSYNPLFLYSPVGLGKTHIMQAILISIRIKHPKLKILYLTSEKFTNELISALQNKRVEEFRNKYRNIDVLLLDDIQFISGKERTQEEFFHTFNQLYNDNKQIILSSDRPPTDIPKLEERLVSRFEWGIMADIQAPDFETRVAILQKKSESIQTAIPQEVLQFIATHFTSNIRELEGALLRIIALSTLESKHITIELAYKLFQPQMQQFHKHITPDTIQQVVCAHFDISLGDLKSSKRKKMFVVPRQIAMYLARELTDYSFPELGSFFGGKDHTTIMHAYEKLKKQLSTPSNLDYTIKELKEKIRG